MKRRLLLNSLSGSVLFGVNLVITFLLSPIVVRELGNQGYGTWEILLSIFGYLSILELGVGPAFIRFVAHAAAKEDRSEMDRVVSSTFTILFTAGLAGFLLTNLIFLSPHKLLKVSSDHVPELRLLGLLLGANFFVQMSGTVFTAYLMGLQRHYVMNGFRIFLAVAQGVATYLALTRGQGSGLVWLSAILLTATTLQLTFFAGWSLLRRPAPSIGWAHVSRDTIRKLYTFGMKSVTMMAANRVSMGSVPIVMGWTLGVAQVPFYAIPNRLASYAVGLGAVLGFPLMPYFSALDGVRDREATVQGWFATTRALQVIMFGMAIGIMTLGKPFIGIWIGPEYAEKGAWVIFFLSLSLMIEGVSPNSSRILVSMNRHGRAAALSLAFAALGVPVTVVLAKLGGVPGVGLAVLVINACIQATMFLLATNALGLARWEHIRRTAAPFVPATVLFAGVSFGLRHIHEVDDYGRLAGYALAGGLVYLIGVWIFVMEKKERTALCGALGTIGRRIAMMV